MTFPNHNLWTGQGNVGPQVETTYPLTMYIVMLAVDLADPIKKVVLLEASGNDLFNDNGDILEVD